MSLNETRMFSDWTLEWDIVTGNDTVGFSVRTATELQLKEFSKILAIFLKP